MVALGREPFGKVLSAATIADRMNIPIRFLAHVLADLGRAGLVVGRTGRGGGYRLALPASEISLLQVVDASGRDAEPTCVLRGGPCDVAGRCAVHDAFWSATEAVRSELAATTLADVSRRVG
jgi:Rrf2 family protein